MRRYIVALLAAAVVSAACVAILRWPWKPSRSVFSIATVQSPVRSVEKDADRSDHMLATGNFDGLSKLATYWAFQSPNADAAEPYTRLLLNCIRARKQRHTGDSLVLLEAADPYLDHLDGTIFASRITAYAKEYESLSLLRRAKLLLEHSYPLNKRRIAELQRALLRFGSTEPSDTPWESNASLITRLGDALRAPPLNPGFDYESWHGKPYSHDDVGPYPGDFQEGRLRPSSGPLLANLYAQTELKLPGLENSHEESLQQVAISAQQRLTVSDQEVLSLMSAASLNVRVRQKQILQHLLLLAGYNAQIAAGFEPITIQHIAETWFVCGLSNEHRYAVAYVNSITPYIWKTSPEDPDTEGQLIDLFGDGKRLAVILSAVRGSGNLLYETMYSLEDGHVLWVGGSEDDDGTMMPLHLAGENSVQLLVAGKTGIQSDGCNQCPGLKETVIYDLHRGERAFRLVARRRGAAEVSKKLGAGGGWGMTYPMQLSAASHETSAKIETLRSEPETMDRRQFTDTVESILDYANDLRETGALQQAEQVYRTLMDAEDRRRDNGHDEHTVSSIALGLAYTFLLSGDYDNVHKALELPGAMTVFNKGGNDRAAYLGVVSKADFQSGHLGLAYKDLQQALDIPSADKGALLGDLALYFLRTGDYRSAYQSATAALDKLISEASKPPKRQKDNSDEEYDPAKDEDAAYNMVWAATAAEELGETGVAADWLLRAFRTARGANDITTLQIYAAETAAHAALRLGDPALALDFLDDALGVAEPIGWRQGAGGFLVLYGRALAAQGMTPEAGKVWRAAAELSQGSSYNDYINAEFELAKLAQASRDRAQAMTHAAAAFAEVSRGRLEIGTEREKMSFLADKKDVTELFLTLCTQSDRTAADILDIIEGWKLRAFLDLYSVNGKNLGQQQESSWKSLSQLLSPDEAFIDFFIGKQLSLAVVIRANAPPMFYQLHSGSRETLDLVSDIRTAMDVHEPTSLVAIQQDKLPDALRAELCDAYNRFLRPLSNSLSGAKRLIISPDEVMFGVPWPALQDGNDSVVDHYETLIAPSANVFAQMLVHRRQKPQLERVAGPSLVVGEFNAVPAAELLKIIPPGDQIGNVAGLATLKNGQSEIKRVGNELAHIGSTKYLLDSRPFGIDSQDVIGIPTRSALLRQLPNFTIIHIAAHGVFSPSDPMNSSLFLAEENGGRTITARELLDLPLQRVDLVTLAACQTAVSSIVSGAEPFGFQRALLGAGASSTLLTEWEIDDSTSAELFPKFYHRLRTSSKSEALRTAQLDVRRSHRHPYYWASVTLVGQPN